MYMAASTGSAKNIAGACCRMPTCYRELSLSSAQLQHLLQTCLLKACQDTHQLWPICDWNDDWERK